MTVHFEDVSRRGSIGRSCHARGLTSLRAASLVEGMGGGNWLCRRKYMEVTVYIF